MSIFRDVFNEWFVADTSKKIRAVFKAKAQAGKHSNSVAPYGYKPSEADKFVWAVDEPAAEIVREIYQMCIDGMGPQYIAKELSCRGLKIPQIYKAERDGVPPKHIPKHPDTDWHTSAVVGILSNREYTGRAILNRKTSKSYKDHRKFIKPEEEWIVHENAHPAIIDDETFATVRRIRDKRRHIRRTYEKGPLADVMYCADCGSRLYPKSSSKANGDGSMARKADYILTSVGSIRSRSWENVIGPEKLARLCDIGCVGHIGGHFFDIGGCEIEGNYKDLLVGLTLEEIRHSRNVICVAASEQKAESVYGALRGGIVDTLMITYPLAVRLMEIVDKRRV